MTNKPWTAADMSSQRGRTVLITGANSGLGLAVAKAFGSAGARVVLAVRDEKRGREAAGTVAGDSEVRQLDLASLASVREFAAGWTGVIDVLINNAGVMAVPYATTTDGFELQFGTNHLGHFALTNLLLPSIQDRIVTVSSVAHRLGRISFDDPNWQHRRYRRWAAYGQSKLANLLFTLDLDRRLASAGSPVRAVAAHPGYASTNLQSHTGSALQGLAMAAANRLFAQSDASGALPILFAATQDLPGTSYVGPNGPGERRGFPVLVGRSARAADPVLASRLWELSCELTGIPFGADDDAGTG